MRLARLALVLALIPAFIPAALEAAPLEHRWVYLPRNLLVDKNVDEGLAILRRAAAAGYNGVVVADTKFMRWDNMPRRYTANVQRFRQAVRDLKLDCIACVCPMGYSNDLLARDPNLAEGLPVVEAPFVARQGKLVPADDTVHVVNGGFEQSRSNAPAGWSFVDQPGKISFIDTDEHFEGRGIAADGRHRPARSAARQRPGLPEAGRPPVPHYHVAVTVKTENFEACGDVQISVIATDGTMLNYYEPRIETHAALAAGGHHLQQPGAPEVNLYLGVWGGRAAKSGGMTCGSSRPAWSTWSAATAPRCGPPARTAKPVYGRPRFPGGRRPQTGHRPLRRRIQRVARSALITLPAGSRIREGDEIRLSYYHTALITRGRSCAAWPSPRCTKSSAGRSSRSTSTLRRTAISSGTTKSACKAGTKAAAIGQNAGPASGRNVRGARHWSTRRTPVSRSTCGPTCSTPAQRPAVGPILPGQRRRALVRLLAGLDKDVTIVNWNSNPHKRVDSLRHFAQAGHRQILAGYYDGPVESIRGWLKDAEQAGGVSGVMYTTWQHRYGDLESFAAQLHDGR